MIENSFLQNNPFELALNPENYTSFARKTLEQPYAAPPYSSMLDDAVNLAEIDIEKARYSFERGFPARLRAGRNPLAPENALGTRISPLRTPERLSGSVKAVSV